MGIILIVDDEPVTQLMLKLMLQRKNHTVVVAGDGQEAMTYLAKEPVDLVIADVNMPKMDGITLLQQLRHDQRFQDLPVIMFTAIGNTYICREATQKGASDFLTKPISSSELAGVVAQHLGMAAA